MDDRATTPTTTPTTGGLGADTITWGLDLLERLVAVPSVTTESSDIGDVLAEELAGLDLQVERVPSDPTVVASSPEHCPPATVPASHDGVLGRTSEPSGRDQLLLFAHVDTEPVHEGWRTSPRELVAVGDRLYGLGVADDKAGVAAILAALWHLRRTGTDPAWDPVVLLAAGKQGGSLGTLQGIEMARGVAGAVYVHPAETGAGLDHLKVGSRGIARFVVDVPGQSPEPVEIRTPVSADPRGGANPVDRAARLVARLHELDSPTLAVTDIRATDPVAHRIPDHVTVEVAAWFTDGLHGELAAVIEDVAAEVARDQWEADHPVVVRQVGLRANPADATGTWLHDAVADVVTRIEGAAPRNYAWHAASDIRLPMRVLDVPAVGLGATAGGFYGPDEWIDVPSWIRSVAVLVQLLQEPRP